MSNSILTAFNDHFLEFVNDVLVLFPNNLDILTAKKSFIFARKANPKLIIRIWKKYIVEKYKTEIESGNIDFFINRDYSSDIKNTSYSDTISESIDRLRNPIKNMDPEDQTKAMKYIQNLTKISELINDID
jgi:hypothetical protein